MALQAPTKTQKAKSNRAPQAELEADNYPCRVAQVLDLGRHYKDVWDDSTRSFKKDTTKPPVNMMMVTYEFTTEFMKDENGNDVEDKPRWLSEQFPLYALDSDLATSTKRYKAFDPTHKLFGGDWSQVAGEPCAVTVALKSNGRAKIGNVAKPMKGMQVGELKNPVKVLNLAEPDLEVFGSLPEWIQQRIKDNLDYIGSPLEALLEGGTVKEKPKEEPAPQEPDVTEDDNDDDAPW